MKELERFIADKFLQVKAVKLQPINPFVWAQGWLSPVYCDNRRLLSYPSVRNVVKLEMASLIAEKYPDAEVIAAVATNAIAIGVLVAEELGLPFVYVHPEPKNHALENRIEGDLRPKSKVVVIEDQIVAGQNAIKVVDALKENGCEVLGMTAIFNFELKEAERIFVKRQLGLHWLCGFGALLDLALERGLLSEADEKILRQWQKNPAKWGK